METNDVQNSSPETVAETTQNTNENKNQSQIAGAILVAGIIIAGAILLNGKGAPTPTPVSAIPGTEKLAPVTSEDRIMGSSGAKVTVIEYADFQCPFCGRFFHDTELALREKYIDTGKIKFVYRDFAFLGPESFQAAEAAHCAADQGKFWEYHDHLYNNQNGENGGAFSDTNLKGFASELGLNMTLFSSCFDSGKYEEMVKESVSLASDAGVRGTPKGFILKNGKVVSTIDGAEALATVTAKIDAALK